MLPQGSLLDVVEDRPWMAGKKKPGGTAGLAANLNESSNDLERNVVRAIKAWFRTEILKAKVFR
jgi:hypothetical protein